MNTDSAKQKLFSDLVDKAIIASRQLISMLDTEYDALTGNNPGLLEDIVNGKKQHLIAISNIMAEQQSLLASLQLSHDTKGVARLYSSLPNDHASKKNWLKLRSLAKTLADSNLRNGILLSQHTANTRKALDILTGHHSEQPLYQYGGKTLSNRQSNSLAYA
jgi:flagellar biosynthesis/type III secretory pathway chaperone